ncbi:MAG: multicopper oxidase family protein [Hyphomicrobiales bacterium]
MPGLITRRNLLQGVGAAGLLVGAPQLMMGQSQSDDGYTVLRAEIGTAPLLGPGKPETDVWAYKGSVPGPFIRARQGEPVRIRFENRLPQASTIHWHGIRIENAMDGVAGLTQDAVPPGEDFDYVFTPPDAGTFWYHPHARSWEQLARGLYGLLIVEEATPLSFAADIPLVLDDWRLDDGGVFHEESLGAMMDWSHAGRLGNWLTVNGSSLPVFDIPKDGPTRLRLVNCSNARVLEVSLKGLTGEIIAIDGQPVPSEGVGDKPLTIAPAQRVDLAAQGLNSGQKASLLAHSRDQTLTIAEFNGAAATGQTLAEPVKLPANPLPTDIDLASAQAVDLVMEGGAMGAMREATYKGKKMAIRELVKEGQVWAFNGVAGRTDKPLFSAPRGQTVTVNMVNATAWPHAMHFHGHHFTAVEKNGAAVEGAQWRDTILLQPEEKVKIALKADNPGKWMLHCHMLEHQAAGMATWFEVV